MYLHRCRFGRLAEDRTSCGEEGVAAGSETLQLCAIEFRTRAQAHLARQHGEMLVDGVSVRRYEASPQLADAHYELVSHFLRVSMDHDRIFVEGGEWNVFRVLGIT